MVKITSTAMTSSLHKELHEMLQKELDLIWAELKESQSPSLSLHKQLADSVSKIKISIDLLHQQILSCHQQAALFKQYSKGKGHFIAKIILGLFSASPASTSVCLLAGMHYVSPYLITQQQ